MIAELLLLALPPQNPGTAQEQPVARAPAPSVTLAVSGVYTGDGRSWPGPIVVQGGRLAQRAKTLPAVYNLPGFYAYPGLCDAHAHLQGLGQKLDQVDLVGAKTYAELIDRVRQRAARTPKGQWVMGRGWDQNEWPGGRFPSHQELSEAIPGHPVFLTRVDGHAALVNAAALQLAGIGKGKRSPPGGEILIDAEQEPTGVLVDTAMGLVRRHMPRTSKADVRRHLLAAQKACIEAGLTAVHDAGMSPSTLEILKELHQQGRWVLRTYVMLPAGARAAIRRGPWRSADGLIDVQAVKGYADGALGSRGAALLEPYADRKGSRGLMITPEKGILKLAQLCADHGMQLCVHAIGDKANRAVLDAYAAVDFAGRRRQSLQEARFRVEHAQVVAPADIPRFAELGVLPSMQPTHLTTDMPWAIRRLGPERCKGAYAWTRFQVLGLRVPFGSDFPVESHDPRLGLFAAVTCRRVGSETVLREDQRIDIRRALQGFTLDAAYASFREQELGSITEGKLADLTLFDRDLLECSPEELLQARVAMTVINGRIVFDATRELLDAKGR